MPSASALDRAISALPRGELEWICEFNGIGPVYLLPTAPFLRALAAELRALKPKRILEVGAGDGHLGRSLALVAPDLNVVMSDSGAWEQSTARMNARERRQHRNVAPLLLGEDVLRLDAQTAIRRLKPDVVLASWLPPGQTLEQLIRSRVQYVLELGAGSGITGDVLCWRFEHEFLEGPIERHARCRLDERPREHLHTRATLYFGRAHERYAEEKVTRGHWLWEMRPR